MFGLFRKEIKGPDREWVEKALKAAPFTPDIQELETRERHLVFEYGTAMRGYRNSDLLNGFLYTAFTNPNVGKYSLWKKKLGPMSFPIALPISFRDTPLRAIKGELHAIRPTQFIELDKYMLNTVQFERVRVNVVIPYSQRLFIKDRAKLEELMGGPLNIRRDGLNTYSDAGSEVIYKGMLKLKAWMYIGLQDYWVTDGEPLDAGYIFEPVQHYVHCRETPGYQPTRPDNYYYFSKKEYDK